ncbi:TPA: type III secretion system effector NleA [Escherichia albertii]|uniref:type III secretion system effector NleA n=1 Tax=Escherichia albertii TaxID=208962 RepID=UPI0011EEF841|nr:type III secretion system effector NleA [Escherichia albertii]EJS1738529.1 type III secretion system effector NleA [Escherichia albertii]UUK75539.1 type III secretion system effector NleA [Escherichia albertii]WDB75951.1 type III secretion system effector NleA [Escherichia albertii]HEB1395137.1 type III secretion system effector NleA [Escherichia albertii]HEB1598859.1 type III secretion system effector NleA [Escherichia albertii]
MNIQPTIQSGITSQNNQHHQTEQIPPTQIPQSELPLGCQAGFVVNIPDDIQQHAPECGETTALLSLIKDKGLLSGLDEYIAPHLEEGSIGKKTLDMFGLFNVTQMALEIPSSVSGISGKYGVQLNIVKPDIHPTSGNYFLQIFPLHDEIGFNFKDLPGPLKNALSNSNISTTAVSTIASAATSAASTAVSTIASTGTSATTSTVTTEPKDPIPWFGLTAQVVRNHGVELPIVKTENGWKLVGETPLTPDGPKANYTEEWVIRPGEADFKYGASPLQATLGLEFGAHFKWDLDNPNTKYAVLTNAAANALGAVGGFAVSRFAGTDPMLSPHIGAMVGQAAGHAIQYNTPGLKPDTILWWAGATLGAADLNKAEYDKARFTDYPRIWWHAREGAIFPNKADIEHATGADIRAMEEGVPVGHRHPKPEDVAINVEGINSQHHNPLNHVDIVDIIQETRI